MRIYKLKLSGSLKEKYSRMNAKNNSRKALDVLSGITLGIIADGSICPEEAQFFNTWINNNESELPSSLISDIVPLLKKIETSSDLTDHDHNELLNLIVNFSGASLDEQKIILSTDQEETSNIGKPANWYFHKEPLTLSDLEDSLFTLTGSFSFGSKSEIVALVESIGSRTKPKQPTQTTDYLIVGEKGSDQWSSSQLGNNILKALSMQDRGHHIKIISESMFLSKAVST